MYHLFKNNFIIGSNIELNSFVNSILEIGETYICFLITKNRMYLPDNINPKDAAVDTLAELFILKENKLIKFFDFFNNNFTANKIKSEIEFENYLKGFIYTVIQNNLVSLYKNNDIFSYNILRCIKEAVSGLNYFVSVHFSDKYISKVENPMITDFFADKDDLFKLVNNNKISNDIFVMKNFLRNLFDALDNQNVLSHTIRLNDLLYVVKSIFAQEYVSRNGASSESEHISERVNVKYILEDARFSFYEKLNKYVCKNNLSKKFTESMYNIIEEVINDFNEGNKRQSVRDLMLKHYIEDDKQIFYRIQYCVSMFENEIAKYFTSKNKL